MNPWGAMMLMGLMDDCNIDHLEVDCSGRGGLAESNRISENLIFYETLLLPLGWI